MIVVIGLYFMQLVLKVNVRVKLNCDIFLFFYFQYYAEIIKLVREVFIEEWFYVVVIVFDIKGFEIRIGFLKSVSLYFVFFKIY